MKILGIVVVSACIAAAFSPDATAAVDAGTVFEELKSLAGTWEGKRVGEGEAAAEGEQQPAVTHQFRVSAASTVVMETMFAGTDHEMINMYFVDGDDLLLTHYCAGGNQPTMRLDRQQSSAERLIFDFVRGTNLDPAVDAHIHAADIELVDGDHLTSRWKPWSGGKQVGMMTFQLQRAR